jgi:VWFA-related protein
MRATVFICLSSLLAAQNPAAPPPQDPVKDAPESVIRESFKFVLAPVTVTNRNKDFVPGLTPYDFRLYDNGKLQKITEDIATHALSLVLVIQANADVEKILPSIQRTSSIFESLVLGDDGEMAVIGFDHRVQVLTDFTNDAGAIDGAFKKLRVGSYTAALNDATMKAINMLKSRPASRKRVVIQIAENRDKGSEIKPREVLTEADFANVSMYSVNVSQLIAALTSQAQPNRPNTLPPGAEHLPMGQVNTATTDSQMNMGNWVPALVDIFDAAKGVFMPDPLDIYTRYSGGHECGFKGDKGLARCVEQIGDELHSQYMLTYLPNNPEEGGYHHIVVEVAKPGLVVRTRDGYWVAAKPK